MAFRLVRSFVKRWITTQFPLQELRRLDEALLRDIGLTRGDIYRTATMQETGYGDIDASGRTSGLLRIPFIGKRRPTSI